MSLSTLLPPISQTAEAAETLFPLAFIEGSALLSSALGAWLIVLSLGLALMGFTYGPLGTALAEPFPTSVRYTGASMTFNLGGIFGASLAPYIATTLATNYGLSAADVSEAVSTAIGGTAASLPRGRHDFTRDQVE